MNNEINPTWSKARADVFWEEIAASDHVMQLYKSESVFLDTLSGFVGEGIRSGNSVVVIATPEHLSALEAQLRSFGIHVPYLISEHLYIPLDAAKTLSEFMVDGMPDEKLFSHTIGGIFAKAKQKHRKIRAFGEMVSLLWEDGAYDATLKLENLWNQLCAKESLCLFCAYPHSVNENNGPVSLSDICCAHRRIINGDVSSLKEVLYYNNN